jgi:hypothetical protein
LTSDMSSSGRDERGAGTQEAQEAQNFLVPFVLLVFLPRIRPISKPIAEC